MLLRLNHRLLTNRVGELKQKIIMVAKPHILKTQIISVFISCLFATTCQAQLQQPLTNNVPVGDWGMRMVLCQHFYDASNAQALFSQKELEYDQPLTWMIHNVTSNASVSIVFLGMTNSFDFKLFNTNGTEVPKTRLGKAMSEGPKSLRQFNANHYVRREGPGAMDFPKLTELFDFPSNGVYILELRYWNWAESKRMFILSEPVRLKVIRNAPVPAEGLPSPH